LKDRKGGRSMADVGTRSAGALSWLREYARRWVIGCDRLMTRTSQYKLSIEKEGTHGLVLSCEGDSEAYLTGSPGVRDWFCQLKAGRGSSSLLIVLLTLVLSLSLCIIVSESSWSPSSSSSSISWSFSEWNLPNL
jgi:hypothetical protein